VEYNGSTSGFGGFVYLPIRQPATSNKSLGVFKNIKFQEWLSVVFGAPVTDFSGKNFGVVASQGNSPRQIQFGLKLIR